MAGNNNQENQKPQRLDEFSDDFFGELSEQDRKALKDWADREENKYKEQRQEQYQVENVKAKLKELDEAYYKGKKKDDFDRAKKRYQKLQAKSKKELDSINADLNSLNEQEQKEAKEKFDQIAPKIIRKYDSELEDQENLLKRAQGTNQRLKEVIEVKKELERLEKERKKIEYTASEIADNTELDMIQVKQSAVGLTSNKREQNDNNVAFQGRMTELNDQLKQIDKEKNKFTTKVYDIFTGNKKKKQLTAALERTQYEILKAKRDFAEKQAAALNTENKLSAKLKNSQANVTNHSEQYGEQTKVYHQLLEQKKQLEEKLEKILDREPNNNNKLTFKLETSSELEELIPNGEKAITKHKNNLVQIPKDKESALDREYQKILQECMQKNKEKHDDLDKQKRALEHPLEQTKSVLDVAERAYQDAEANYKQKVQNIKLEAINKRTKPGMEYFDKVNALKDKKKKVETRLQKYALLSQAIEELKHSEKKGSSTNSNEFQTMIDALESFSTLMRNPDSKQADMDQSCLNAIQACENYVEKRNRDYLRFMRTDSGQYRINRATSISSALKKFSPDVAAQFEQQKETTSTRTRERVSFTENSNQRMVRSNPTEVSKKAAEKAK